MEGLNFVGMAHASHGGLVRNEIDIKSIFGFDWAIRKFIKKKKYKLKFVEQAKKI